MTFIYWVCTSIVIRLVCLSNSIQGSVTKLVRYLYTHTYHRIPLFFYDNVNVRSNVEAFGRIYVFLSDSYSYNQISNYFMTCRWKYKNNKLCKECTPSCSSGGARNVCNISHIIYFLSLLLSFKISLSILEYFLSQ